MIDSGAQKSIIGYQLYKAIIQSNEDKVLDLLPCTLNLQSVTGSALALRGTLPKLSFKLNSTEFRHDFLVADNSLLQGIIGSDFLISNFAILDFENLVLIFSKLDLTVKMHHRSSVREKISVIVSSEVYVGPKCCVEVRCDLAGSEGVKAEALGCYQYSSSDVWYNEIETPIYVREQFLTVPVYNNDNQLTLKIDKNTIMGSLSPINYTMNSILDEKHNFTDSERVEKVLKILKIENNDHINEAQKQRLIKLVSKYCRIFALSIYDLKTPTDLIVHHVPLTTDVPVRCPYRPVPIHLSEEVAEEIQTMLEVGILERSDSEYSSPALILKKGNKTRILIDLRTVNSITKRSYAPVPDLASITAHFSGSKFFSNLDFKSSFYQVEVAKEDRHKLCMSIPGSIHGNWARMPMGGSGSPATMQSLLDKLLRGVRNTKGFIDDVCIHSIDFDTSFNTLQELFERMLKHHLLLNPEKVILCRPQIKFLGRILSHEGVSACPDKTNAIRNMAEPTTRKAMLTFIGAASWLRSMIPNFAAKAAGLYATLKLKKFKMDDAARSSFEAVKEALLHPKLLIYPMLDKKMTLITDCSQYAAGGCVCHIIDDQIHPLSYGSRILNPAQVNYAQYKKELWALKTFMIMYKYMLLGAAFDCWVDAKSLTYSLEAILTKTDCQVVLRWILEMSQFTYTITYKKGDSSSMAMADCLSRMPSTSDELYFYWQQQIQRSGKMPANELVSVIKEAHDNHPDVTPAEGTWENPLPPIVDNKLNLKHAQMHDKTLLQVREWIVDGAKPAMKAAAVFGTDLRIYFKHFESLAISGPQQLVCYKFLGRINKYRFLICIPASETAKILELTHDLGGHLGTFKSTERIRQRFYIPDCATVVKHHCDTCSQCYYTNLSYKRKPVAKLQPFPAGSPNGCVHFDACGPLSRKGVNRYILVIICKFTRFCNCVALPNLRAKTIARTLLDHWSNLFGHPAVLCSDKQPSFCTAEVIKEFYKVTGVIKRNTVAYWPQGDGQAEQLVRSIKNVLTKLVDQHPERWEAMLSSAVFALNSSVNSVTKFAPSYLMFGYQVRAPVDLYYGLTTTKFYRNGNHRVSEAYHEIKAAYDLARENAHQVQQRQKRLYDTRESGADYKVGDWCVYHRPIPEKVKDYRKFHRKWSLPHEVSRKLGEVNYEITELNSGKKTVTHFNLMRPYPRDMRIGKNLLTKNKTDSSQALTVQNENSDSESEWCRLGRPGDQRVVGSTRSNAMGSGDKAGKDKGETSGPSEAGGAGSSGVAGSSREVMANPELDGDREAMPGSGDPGTSDTSSVEREQLGQSGGGRNKVSSTSLENSNAGGLKVSRGSELWHNILQNSPKIPVRKSKRKKKQTEFFGVNEGQASVEDAEVSELEEPEPGARSLANVAKAKRESLRKGMESLTKANNEKSRKSQK